MTLDLRDVTFETNTRILVTLAETQVASHLMPALDHGNQLFDHSFSDVTSVVTRGQPHEHQSTRA